MTSDSDLMAPVPFGRAMRDKHFLFEPAYNPLNHGSFGTYPKLVKKRFHEVQALSEARPDSFVRYEMPRMLDQSRTAIATYLNVPVDEVVLMPNASTAANVVLRCLKFEKEDVVVHLSTLYGAVEKTLEFLKEMTPVQCVVIEVDYPISDDELVGKFHDGIKRAKAAGKKVRLAIVDTISSLPGVVQPWDRFVAVCKEEGVLSFVDGAHSVGHIPLELSRVQPDFFVSNLHKWLFVPRACAIFQVPKRNQHIIRSSLPTSHGFVPLPGEGKPIFNPIPMSGKSPFVLLFQFVATLDSSPYFCIEEALRFRKDVCGGEQRIMEYCRKISDEAGKRAAGFFGTEIMENAQGSLNRCAFSNVRLPLTIGPSKEEVPQEEAIQAASWMAEHLLSEYDTFAALYVHGHSFWVRFSGQIYLETEDFDRGAKALSELCARVRAGEHQVDALNEFLWSQKIGENEANQEVVVGSSG